MSAFAMTLPLVLAWLALVLGVFLCAWLAARWQKAERQAGALPLTEQEERAITDYARIYGIPAESLRARYRKMRCERDVERTAELVRAERGERP